MKVTRSENVVFSFSQVHLTFYHNTSQNSKWQVSKRGWYWFSDKLYELILTIWKNSKQFDIWIRTSNQKLCFQIIYKLFIPNACLNIVGFLVGILLF